MRNKLVFDKYKGNHQEAIQGFMDEFDFGIYSDRFHPRRVYPHMHVISNHEGHYLQPSFTDEDLFIDGPEVKEVGSEWLYSISKSGGQIRLKDDFFYLCLPMRTRSLTKIIRTRINMNPKQLFVRT